MREWEAQEVHGRMCGHAGMTERIQKHNTENRTEQINKKLYEGNASEGSTADSVVPGLHSNHLVHKSLRQSNACLLPFLHTLSPYSTFSL